MIHYCAIDMGHLRWWLTNRVWRENRPDPDGLHEALRATTDSLRMARTSGRNLELHLGHHRQPKGVVTCHHERAYHKRAEHR